MFFHDHTLVFQKSTLNDPYSKFLTREELLEERSTENINEGFLGLGMIVESYAQNKFSKNAQNIGNDQVWSPSLLYTTRVNYGSSNSILLTNPPNPQTIISSSSSSSNNNNNIIAVTRADNLPIVIAVKPNSPAERSGIVVGDRIASVQNDKFIGLTQEEVSKKLNTRYNAENYAGYPEITVAKPIYKDVIRTRYENNNIDPNSNQLLLEKSDASNNLSRGRIIGYRLSKARIPTSSLAPFRLYKSSSTAVNNLEDSLSLEASTSSPSTPIVAGGNSICYYQLLTPNDSIFNSLSLGSNPSSSTMKDDQLVGYIRLTRFSRSSTTGYLEAVRALEEAGASSYIIDLRNNYGGVIQEAMLTASTLLRDPATVLCYTINSRGGFTPHDVEEYVVDTRYPGYLLSTESNDVTMAQVRKNNPNIFRDGEWLPPSQFASLHEQGVKRGTRRTSNAALYDDIELERLRKQKRIVLLINEGTASSAEVFASSLHDNGRTVALVGAKTYGKGLIQHTFPMPDGGGLRLTVAEYLTPALQHVTKVGSARYNAVTGEMVGGGVQPDIYCESKGIPSNPGADICVGIALDAIEDAKAKEELNMMDRMGGTSGGFGKRRVVTAGVVKVCIFTCILKYEKDVLY